nr:PAS domain S-box protein [Actinomycetes bacterium]
MEPPAIGANEAERLAVLRSYGILDTPPEPRFDALTKLAANILKVPVALITFIDTDRQWFKSRYGLDAPETPRDVSFCGHVVANEAPLVVPDALRDPRFSDNPLVTGDPIVRFYAGVPLKTPDGFFLGTFCAIDHEARENDGTEVETLELLAGQVVEILELQRQHTQSERQLRDELVVSGLRLEQLETHRQFFDLTLDLLCTVNSSLYFEQLNPMWEEVLGWTLDELRARPLLEFVHSDDLERTEAEAARLLAEASTTINFENRYRHKDGSWVPLSWVARARDGVFFCAARDMTSYYATARALQASEARLRAIIDTAVDAILTFDESGCIERANPAIERIFGHSASELVGQNVTVLMPAPGGEPNASYLANYVEAGPGEAIGIGREVTGRHKDGTLFPAELVISEMLVDGQKLFTGIIRDVSLRKQAERELNQFRVTLDRTNEAILIFDPVDLRFTYANHGAVKHLGYSIDELLQKTPLDLKPEFDEAQYREVLESLITGQSEATTFETVHRHKDGHDIPVEIVLQFMAPPGELPRFINIVRDISERKRLDRLTAEFVSMVSHELRTPLTSIRGSLGLVANGVTGQLPPQAQEYVGIALSNCERLVRLINDILDVEKIQSGKTVLRLQPVDLVEVVRKALATNEA